MKTSADIQKNLQAFQDRFKLPILGAEQGSQAWLHMKMGVISASKADKVVAGKTTEGRLSYMSELVAQVCTGEMEEINAPALAWGKQYESAARSSYELANKVEVDEVSFVYMDDSYRVGCSPDFLLYPHKKGGELKCPFKTANYIKFLCEEKIKSEYQWQAQFSMHVLDSDEWEFAQYDPRMTTKMLHQMVVRRDPEAQKKIADALPAFISDMDDMLKKAGVEFGSQWHRLAAAQTEAQQAEQGN